MINHMARMECMSTLMMMMMMMEKMNMNPILFRNRLYIYIYIREPILVKSLAGSSVATVRIIEKLLKCELRFWV